MSNPSTREKTSLYRAFCLVKLTRQASKERDPSIHVWRGAKCKTVVLKYLQKQMNSSRLLKIECRPATKNADRQYTLPMASKHQPVASGRGR